MNRQQTQAPFWSTAPVRVAVVVAAILTAVILSGCSNNRVPTADDFVLAQKYCAERGLAPVSLINGYGALAGVACESKDARSWYLIPDSVFEQKRAALVGAK